MCSADPNVDARTDLESKGVGNVGLVVQIKMVQNKRQTLIGKLVRAEQILVKQSLGPKRTDHLIRLEMNQVLAEILLVPSMLAQKLLKSFAAQN